MSLLPGQCELITPGQSAGLVFGRLVDGAPLSQPLGWGGADVATQDALPARGDGARFGRDTIGTQTVSLSLVVAADRVDEIVAAWHDPAVRDMPGALCALRVGRDGGARRVVGRPRRFTPVEKKGWRAAGWLAAEAEFVAADPLWYADTEQVLSVPAVASGSAGGLSWPLSWPLSWTALPRARDVVRNAGSAPTWPRVTFYGPVTGQAVDPTLRGVHTGQVLTLARTLGVGERVTVETRLNGRGAWTPDGANLGGSLRGAFLDEWSLAPGDTELDFEVDDPSGTASVDVAWRDAWWSL